jgi:tetratricopeptide (TPR) repeat protein
MPGILETLGIDSATLEANDANAARPEEATEEPLQFAPREQELELLAAEAEELKVSAPERVRIWLELSELHRRLAHSNPAQKRARLKQSELVARRALEIAAQARDSRGYLSSLDALADVFASQDRYPSAEKVLQEAIRLEASMPHPDAFRTAQRMHLIGVLRHRAGNLDEAVPALEKAIKLHEENLGAEHDDTLRVLAKLGAVHRARGQHEAARKSLRHVLRHFQNTKGPMSEEALALLFELAGAYEDSGDMQAASVEYERLLLLVNREVGRDYQEVAELQFSVASLYIRWGEFARAREMLADCIGTFRRGGGPRLAVCHETLAHVEEALGHYNDAVRELASAGKVWAKCLDRNAELAVNMNYRAELLDLLKRTREAAWLREQATALEAESTPAAAAPAMVVQRAT